MTTLSREAASDSAMPALLPTITTRARRVEELVLGEGIRLRFNLALVVQLAIDEAVVEERGACAAIAKDAAETPDDHEAGVALNIAAAIRARGRTP